MSAVYLVLRMMRRLTPGFASRAMLDLGLVLQPGLETRSPEQAVRRYRAELERRRFALSGKSVLVFGYGGSYGVGIGFLQAGARLVTLCDLYARPSPRRNRTWAKTFPQYFEPTGERRPKQELIRLLHTDIRRYAQDKATEFDLVVSSSVFEHLDDCDGITFSLAALTKSDGAHLHFIDLRDHFFRYPFEMLTFSQAAWRRYLNPPSNLNRLRAWQFEAVFNRHFGNVAMQVIDALPAEFNRIRARIRPEFLSGQEALDAAGILSIWATQPLGGPCSRQVLRS
jgi:hypothetical protein